MERWQLTQFQNLPLDVKIAKSRLRIREWYEHYGGQVNVSFSGGKDNEYKFKMKSHLLKV